MFKFKNIPIKLLFCQSYTKQLYKDKLVEKRLYTQLHANSEKNVFLNHICSLEARAEKPIQFLIKYENLVMRHRWLLF